MQVNVLRSAFAAFALTGALLAGTAAVAAASHPALSAVSVVVADGEPGTTTPPPTSKDDNGWS